MYRDQHGECTYTHYLALLNCNPMPYLPEFPLRIKTIQTELTPCIHLSLSLQHHLSLEAPLS